MQTSPASQRAAGIGLGAVVLALLAALAIGLPKALGDTGLPSLPDKLPGGWVAGDTLTEDEVPAGAENVLAQLDQLDYIDQVYGEVYDTTPEFRVYTDATLQRYAAVTVYAGEGGAFGPGQGVFEGSTIGLAQDPVQVERRGETLCVLTYPAAPAGQPSTEANLPTSVNCQAPAGGNTVAVNVSGVDVDDAFGLVDDVVADIS